MHHGEVAGHATSPELIDELRRHRPDVSDVMMNSPWPQGCENSDGHAWALMLLGENVTKECCQAGPVITRTPHIAGQPS
jgi:hypothetical protein